MPQSTAPHTLLPQQSRLINASEGIRLEVQSGCLWLTRPGDAVDRFLVAGSSIELHENHVLVQSDSPRSTGGAQTAHYRLTPLNAPHAVAQQTQRNEARFPGGLKAIFRSFGLDFMPKLKAPFP